MKILTFGQQCNFPGENINEFEDEIEDDLAFNYKNDKLKKNKNKSRNKDDIDTKKEEDNYNDLKLDDDKIKNNKTKLINKKIKIINKEDEDRDKNIAKYKLNLDCKTNNIQVKLDKDHFKRLVKKFE